MACILLRCIFLLSCLMVIEVCLGRIVSNKQVVPNSAEKVPVSLYYETLCPGCQEFILEGLAPMVKSELIDIVELKLIPWGNAAITPEKSFECQHGQDECLLNTVEACAIDAWPSTMKHFPFIDCVENLAYQEKHDQWEICFEKLALDPKPVKDCSSGQHGKDLELNYAAETAALRPAHEYVPWVVVNGQPIREDIDKLVMYICKAYKGTLPSACNGTSSGSSPRQESTPHVYPACYAKSDVNGIRS